MKAMYISLLKSATLLILIMNIGGSLNAQDLTNSYHKIRKQGTVSASDTIIVVTPKGSKLTVEKTKEEKKTIFDLSEKGQKELIASYAKIDTNSEKLRKNIKEALSESKPKSKTFFNEDLKEIPRRLELLIEDKWGLKCPSNRIQSLKFEIILKGDEYKFSEFVGFQTKFEYFDIGSLSRTKVRSFSAGIDGSIGTDSSIDVDATASYEDSNTIVESVNLRKRNISQLGFISDKRMVVYMEGNPSYNLNGLVGIGYKLVSDKVNIKFNEYAVSKIDPKKGLFLEKKMILKPSATDVKADIKVSYVYRKVKRRGKYASEGKHVICYYKESDKEIYHDFLMVPKGDLKRDIFQIIYSNGHKPMQVVYSYKKGDKHQLAFLTREEAYKIKELLVNKTAINSADYEFFYLKPGTDKEIKTILINDVTKLGINANPMD